LLQRVKSIFGRFLRLCSFLSAKNKKNSIFSCDRCLKIERQVRNANWVGEEKEFFTANGNFAESMYFA